MNTKEYISSGILEEYALGVLSPQETQEVECMSHIYPEVKEALEEAQLSIEGMASAMAKTPPPELKKDILSAIEDVPQEKPTSNQETSKSETPVRALPQQSNNTRYFITIAASITVLFVVGAYFIIQLNKKEDAIATLKNQNTTLNNDLTALYSKVQTLQYQNEDVNKNLAIIQDETTEKVQLNGTPNQENASVTVYWNKSSKDVYMSVNQLETPPSDLQYQLWALVDGVPVDMGVFDLTGDESMKLMTQIENAGAFAITLEKQGGSPTPNLDQLVVIGEV